MDAVGFLHIAAEQSSALAGLDCEEFGRRANKASIKLVKVVERKVLQHKQ